MKVIIVSFIVIAIIVLKETLAEIGRGIGKDLYKILKGLIREIIVRHNSVKIEIEVHRPLGVVVFVFFFGSALVSACL